MSICVYKLLCTSNGRFYIGSSTEFHKRRRRHMGDLRKQKHNNVFLQRTYNKYGEESFKWQVIYVDTEADARELEQHYIDKYSRDKRCMNIGCTASGGDNLTRHPKRRSIVARISKTLRERAARMSEQERKDRWGHSGESNGMHGRTHSKEARRKQREINLGRTPPNKGVAMSEEQKLKLSARRLGRFTGADNAFYGKQHTQATKDAISARAKERTSAPDFKHAQARSVTCDGVVYASVSEAARSIGCAPGSILFRIKSPNFKYAYTCD